LGYYIQRFIAFASLGLLVEVLFTGAHSFLVLKNKSAQAKTYLWMIPIYGIGGILLQINRDVLVSIGVPLLLRAVVHVVIIYIIEFLSGLSLHYLIGKCPWKYVVSDTREEIHRFSIMGFVRVDYALFWYILALFFDGYSNRISDIIDRMSQV